MQLNTHTLQPIYRMEISPHSPENIVSSSTCIKCNSISEIKPYFAKATADTLVILDIDYTLRMPKQPFFQMKVVGKKENWAFVMQSFKQMTEEENAIFKALFCMRTQSMLVNDEFPSIIKEMQERGVKVIALSSAFVGEIESTTVEEFRYQDLKDLGIDFSTSFPQLETTSFCQLSAFLGRYPVYHKGILLTNREINSKGDVLNAFLDYVDWTPKEILFVDDMKHNIEAEEAALKQRQIESYQTFLYGEANQYPSDEVLSTITHEDFKEEWMKIVNEAKKLSSQMLTNHSLEGAIKV